MTSGVVPCLNQFTDKEEFLHGSVKIHAKVPTSRDFGVRIFFTKQLLLFPKDLPLNYFEFSRISRSYS